MDKLTIENFRCFRNRQTVRLAPLTLLVGENSTGKTSLMAMTRILWNTVYRGEHRPDFKEIPYDLGSFREIVHQAGDNDGPANVFSAGFGVGDWMCEAKFRQGRISTEVFQLHIKQQQASITWNRTSDVRIDVEAKTAEGRWQLAKNNHVNQEIGFARKSLSEQWGLSSTPTYLGENSEITAGDKKLLLDLVLTPYLAIVRKAGEEVLGLPPTAMAPVRSRPKRTYDPGSGFVDPEGAGVPAFLAALAQSDPEQWERLKKAMEVCGKQTGVFDEIQIYPREEEPSSAPFHLQVRKHVGSRPGPWSNLVDVGYGVSQILPIIFELTRLPESTMLLLQQPEVHLHPSAQAGLGSILCTVAASQQQILVETHSDHLINRVRMDVRDRKTDLGPDDVSILFFERNERDMRIHSLEIDSEGNLLNAPPSYGKFFMDEVNRSMGL